MDGAGRPATAGRPGAAVVAAQAVGSGLRRHCARRRWPAVLSTQVDRLHALQVN